jgi:arginase
VTSAWIAVGAPLDCSGTSRGEERAPAAIRAAGLLDRLEVEDLGDAHQPIATAVRDAETGIVAYREILQANEAVRDAVGRVLAREGRPLVLGGDCSFLPGAIAAVRHAGHRVGLVLVDGHPDCHDGSTSATGEAADMELALVTGRGPDALTQLGLPAPLVQPEDAAVLGYGRERPEDAREADLCDRRVQLIEARTLRSGDPATAAAALAERLAGSTDRLWVHFDVDVLDQTVMPAVTYPHLAGLGWEDAEAILAALLARPELAGLSVADYVPPLDPDGAALERLMGLLEGVLTARNRRSP